MRRGYEWLGGKYIADGVADRIINFYYLRLCSE